MNLLKETIEAIAKFGKAIEMISFISDGNGDFGWPTFQLLADKEYDNGYGSAEVNESLVIVFDDGSWMTREEYDGYEWWRINSMPKAKKLATTTPEIFKKDNW